SGVVLEPRGDDVRAFGERDSAQFVQRLPDRAVIEFEIDLEQLIDQQILLAGLVGPIVSPGGACAPSRVPRTKGRLDDLRLDGCQIAYGRSTSWPISRPTGGPTSRPTRWFG